MKTTGFTRVRFLHGASEVTKSLRTVLKLVNCGRDISLYGDLCKLCGLRLCAVLREGGVEPFDRVRRACQRVSNHLNAHPTRRPARTEQSHSGPRSVDNALTSPALKLRSPKRLARNLVFVQSKTGSRTGRKPNQPISRISLIQFIGLIILYSPCCPRDSGPLDCYKRSTANKAAGRDLRRPNKKH